MLTLQIVNSAGGVESATVHATLTEALNEYAGWKDETLRYTITGKVTAECACKRVMESRNRTLHLALAVVHYSEEVGALSVPQPIELKAPQICKLLSSLLPADTLVHLTVTNDDMQVA